MSVRPHHSGYWVADIAAGGKRERRVFKSRTAAETWYRQRRGELKRMGQVAFSLTDVDRLRYMAADAQLRGAGLTLEEVVANAIASGVKRCSSVKLRDAWEALILDKAGAGRRSNYLKRLRHTGKALCDGVGYDTEVKAITKADMRAWWDAQTQWGLATKRGILQAIRVAWAFFVANDMAQEDVTASIAGVTVDSHVPDVLTPEQCEKLLAETLKQPQLVPYVAVSLFAGLRRSEASVITWDDIDLENGWLTVRPEVSKTRSRRVINLHPTCVEWLKLGGKLPLGIDSRPIRNLFKTTIPRGMKNPLRHTAATMLLGLFEDAGKTANHLGNTPDVLHKHYKGHATPGDIEQFWRLTPEHVRKTLKTGDFKAK